MRAINPVGVHIVQLGRVQKGALNPVSDLGRSKVVELAPATGIASVGKEVKVRHNCLSV